VAYVVGFEQDADRELYRGLRQLLSYDPDLINAMYVTPHRWTPFYREAADRRVVETDPSRWDYRHQVLAAGIPPWRLFWWVKVTELILQLRPRVLRRVLAHRDRTIRRALRWCYGVARRAWLFEVRDFLGRQARRPDGLTLHKFWGAPLNHEPTNAAALDAEPSRPLQSPTTCPAVRNTVIG
jgi:anaerobic magnesium-protoporphyrin IX monomethyl ester cyclase